MHSDLRAGAVVEAQTGFCHQCAECREQEPVQGVLAHIVELQVSAL